MYCSARTRDEVKKRLLSRVAIVMGWVRICPTKGSRNKRKSGVSQPKGMGSYYEWPYSRAYPVPRIPFYLLNEVFGAKGRVKIKQVGVRHNREIWMGPIDRSLSFAGNAKSLGHPMDRATKYTGPRRGRMACLMVSGGWLSGNERRRPKSDGVTFPTHGPVYARAVENPWT